jgi:hypothetical protein
MPRYSLAVSQLLPQNCSETPVLVSRSPDKPGLAMAEEVTATVTNVKSAMHVLHEANCAATGAPVKNSGKSKYNSQSGNHRSSQGVGL